MNGLVWKDRIRPLTQWAQRLGRSGHQARSSASWCRIASPMRWFQIRCAATGQSGDRRPRTVGVWCCGIRPGCWISTACVRAGPDLRERSRGPAADDQIATRAQRVRPRRLRSGGSEQVIRRRGPAAHAKYTGAALFAPALHCRAPRTPRPSKVSRGGRYQLADRHHGRLPPTPGLITMPYDFAWRRAGAIFGLRSLRRKQSSAARGLAQRAALDRHETRAQKAVQAGEVLCCTTTG